MTTRALTAPLAALALAAGPLLPAAAQEGEEIVIGLAAEATSVDPHFHNLGPNNQIAAEIFDALINQGPNQELEPGLATSWAPIDDTTWEFRLREGVEFHDGSPFTADDVLCTFERAPNVPNSPSSFATYTQGKTVEKVDDYTIHIRTDEPYPLMANDVSTIAIVSDEKGCEASTEAFNEGEAAYGTGPWRFVEYVPGERIALERYEDYWGEKPAYARAVLRPIKSGPARVAALLSGDVDLISDVPTTDVAGLKENPEIQLSQGVSNRVIYLHLDHYRETSPFVKGPDGGEIENPLMKPQVREAISLAIDRTLIQDRVMEGLSIPAGQLLPEGFFGVSEELSPPEADPARAKELLAQAGYPDGFRLTIHGPNDRYVNDAKIAEAVAQMLTRVGIETSVETMPRSIYFKRASAGADGEPEFSFILVGWGAGSGEASSPLRSLIHTYDPDAGMGASNRGRYSNEAVDAMIQEALRTVDDEKREALLAEATEKAIRDHAIIPIHYQVNVWAARKGIEYTPRTDEYTMPSGATPSG